MNIVLGITGSIAAYKAAELARQLMKAGHTIRVVMTDSARQFIHANTLAVLSQHKVYSTFFADNDIVIRHIELAKWADGIVIAPASAAIIARLAQGLSDDLLSVICMATTAPIYLAPAMNQQMWANPLVRQNTATLRQHGYHLLCPENGEQACGDEGIGRMMAPEKIVAALHDDIDSRLSNKTIVITAGPTREAIDPIRYLSNHSSGKMGYALARACKQRGAKVILISGKTVIAKPDVDVLIEIDSADDMLKAVMAHSNAADILIAAAAVADYKAKQTAITKIKKDSANLMMELVPTTDIVATVTRQVKRPFVVGFCAETTRLITAAKEKLQGKKMDMIIANQVTTDGQPFYQDTNEVTVLTADNQQVHFDRQHKTDLAQKLIKFIADYCFSQK
ncbi:MAG: bifunctional phosphopantothenoylcysteine decarboxylase/phosphopantothenate--cysteine ligase CoaBC [Pseudomonadota bacterium]